MDIFEFNTDDSMSELEKQYKYYLEVYNSFAEHRSIYRDLANRISISWDSIEKCCSVYETYILIQTYTYAERLVKNLYYELLNKGKNIDYIEQYLDKKIPAKRFSPNVKYEEMQKSIGNELLAGFKFIIGDGRNEIKTYNNLVEARHIFAHRGMMVFNNSYQEVFNVEKYIAKEFEMIIIKGNEFRIQYQRDIFELKDISPKIQKSIKKYRDGAKYENKKKEIATDLKMLKKLCVKIEKEYNDYLIQSVMLSDVVTFVQHIASCDLRKQNDVHEYILNNTTKLLNCIC